MSIATCFTPVAVFLSLHDRFWNLLAPYCTVHTGVKKVPFVTSTCRGYGKTASIDGEVISLHSFDCLNVFT